LRLIKVLSTLGKAQVVMATPASGTLYSIPFSHYCELARWSLQVAKIPFEEWSYLPGLHAMAGPMARIRETAAEKGTGKGPGTPLFQDAEGKVYDDSWQILKLAKLGDIPEDIFQILNFTIGPRSRAVIYADLLKTEMDDAFYKLGVECPVSWWQRWLWSFSGFRRKVAGKMWETMVGDEAKQAKTLADFEEGIQKLEAELAKPDGCFKGAPAQLNAASLALAALFAPAVCSPDYTGGFVPPILLEVFSTPQQQRIQAWRDRPLGKFVLEVYRLHRCAGQAS